MSFSPHPGAPPRPPRPPDPLLHPGGRGGLRFGSATASALAGASAIVAAAAGALRGVIVSGAERLIGQSSRPAPPALGPGLAPAYAELVYELLDAHSDTAALASDLELDDDWLSHLEYLRALQRHGRGLLAQLAVETAR
jgi:hypothetical protein